MFCFFAMVVKRPSSSPSFRMSRICDLRADGVNRLLVGVVAGRGALRPAGHAFDVRADHHHAALLRRGDEGRGPRQLVLHRHAGGAHALQAGARDDDDGLVLLRGEVLGRGVGLVVVLDAEPLEEHRELQRARALAARGDEDRGLRLRGGRLRQGLGGRAERGEGGDGDNEQERWFDDVMAGYLGKLPGAPRAGQVAVGRSKYDGLGRGRARRQKRADSSSSQ